MRVIRPSSEGVVSTEMCVAFDFGFCLHSSQTLHDSAGIDRLLRDTPLTKRPQLLFEMGEFSNPFIDVGNVLVEDRIDGATTVCRLVRQIEQRMDLFLAHVQCPAIAYETQAFNVFGPIHPEISRRARRLRKEPGLLVIAHRFHRALRHQG